LRVGKVIAKKAVCSFLKTKDHWITATGKKRGAEVAEIEKPKASRGNGKRVPQPGIWRSVVCKHPPTFAPAKDSFAAFPASKSTFVGKNVRIKYARKICVFS